MSLTNEKVGNRKNFIVLGDILADVNMVKNIDYDNLICIGFLNKPKDVMSFILFLILISWRKMFRPTLQNTMS